MFAGVRTVCTNHPALLQKQRKPQYWARAEKSGKKRKFWGLWRPVANARNPARGSLETDVRSARFGR